MARGACDQFLVPPVHAVEIPDGDHRTTQHVGNRIVFSHQREQAVIIVLSLRWPPSCRARLVIRPACP